MKRIIPFLMIVLVPFTLLQAQEKTAEKELTELLEQFLHGASVNDAEMHDRFWAEDLIYTSSAGERYGKDRIMEGMQDAEINESPDLVYTAENIRIQVYGDMAVVAFQLVGTSPDSVMNFLNSGTFLKREGEWRVVNWQATRMAD